MYQTIFMRCTINWILTRGSGAALAAVERVSALLYLSGYKMSTFGEGSQGGEETAAPAAGGDQQQHSCWEDRSATQDVKMNGMIGVSSSVQQSATLSDHASVWTSGALELSLDQPDQAAALIFARQMYTLLVHLREERALAIVRGAPDHNGSGSVEPTA